MNKKIAILAALVMVVGLSVYAEVDPKALPIIQDIRQGRDNANQIDVLRVRGAATVGGALTVAGASTVTGNQTVTGDQAVTGTQTVSGLQKDVPTALSVTNGQAVTVAEQSYLVSGIGGATDTTNTITLVAPGASLVGTTVKFINAGTSTNLITIADGTTAKLTAAWVGDDYDALILYALDASYWVELGRNDN